MCKAVDEFVKEKVAIGRQEGKIEERLTLIKNTMKSLGCSLKKAMEILMLSSDDYNMYANMIKE